MGSSNIIRDCVKSICSGGMTFMPTCPSIQENFKGVTSVMLEDVCEPEHKHEEGGDDHVNIDYNDLDEGNSYENGDNIGVFTSTENTAVLDLSNDEISNGGGDNSDDYAGNSIDQIDNDKEELDPSRLENLLLDDSDDKLT